LEAPGAVFEGGAAVFAAESLKSDGRWLNVDLPDQPVTGYDVQNET